MGRLGWSVLALLCAGLGLSFILGVLVTEEDVFISPAFFTTFAILLIVGGAGLLLIKSIGPTKSAAARRIRHTVGPSGVPGLEVRLRRVTEVFGALVLVCLFALLVEAAAAAIDAGNPLLGILVGVLAVPIVPVIIDTVTTWPCRRALVLTPETLAIELGSDSITLGWDDVDSVDMDVRTVRIKGIIPFRYAYVVVRPKAGATSLAVAPRRRFRIGSRRFHRDGILISTLLLDRPERVRDLLDTMSRQPCRGKPEQQRQDILSSAVGYLTTEARLSARSTAGD